MLIKHLPTDQPDDPTLPSQARRQWLTRIAKAGAGTVILSLAGTQIARGANIVAVRVWPAEDYTRVTIESDVALKATHQLIKDPDRLMVDVEGLDLNPTLRELVAKITPNDPYIRQVRVGQNRPKVVRLVIDLKQAIKPQVFRATPPTPQRGEKTVVSVMAGIRVAQMRAAFPNSFTVIRVMPNLGLSVGEGATAIASDGLTEASLQLAESIFQSCGKTVRVSEDLIDAVTGVSGSCPMYVFEFVEALTQGGVDAGLTRETAYELALQTVKGSAKILENSTDAPQTWSARVRSPGGTTAEAQKVLEAGNFHDLVNRAVQAAVRRSKELSG